MQYGLGTHALAMLLMLLMHYRHLRKRYTNSSGYLLIKLQRALVCDNTALQSSQINPPPKRNWIKKKSGHTYDHCERDFYFVQN